MHPDTKTNCTVKIMTISQEKYYKTVTMQVHIKLSTVKPRGDVYLLKWKNLQAAIFLNLNSQDKLWLYQNEYENQAMNNYPENIMRNTR